MRRRSRESGIALITVLWVLLLLSALVACSAYVTRSQAILSRRAADLTTARAALDAGVIDTISTLAVADPQTAQQLLQAGKDWQFNEATVHIQISREASRIDVNSSDPDLVLAYLLKRGMSDETANRMIASLLFYEHRRDEDRSKGIPSMRLASLNSLAEVPNWSTFDVSCVDSDLTAYSGSSTLISDQMSPLVIAAYNAWHPGIELPDSSQGGVLIGEVLRIHASTLLQTIGTVGATWVGRVIGDHQAAYMTLMWRNDMASSSTDGCQSVTSR